METPVVRLTRSFLSPSSSSFVLPSSSCGPSSPQYMVELELHTVVSPFVPKEVATFLQIRGTFHQICPLSPSASKKIGELEGVITKKLPPASQYCWTKAWDTYSPGLAEVREILFRPTGSLRCKKSALHSVFRKTDLEGAEGVYPMLFVIEKVSLDRHFQGKGLGNLFLREVFKLLGSERFDTAVIQPKPLGFTSIKSQKKRRAMVKIVQFLRDLGFRKFASRPVMLSRPWEPNHPCHLKHVEDYQPYKMYGGEGIQKTTPPLSDSDSSTTSELPSPRTPDSSSLSERESKRKIKRSKKKKAGKSPSPVSSTPSTPSSSTSSGSLSFSPDTPSLFHLSLSPKALSGFVSPDSMNLSPTRFMCTCGGCLQGWLSIRMQYKLTRMANLPFETINDVPVLSNEALYHRTCVLLVGELIQRKIVPTTTALTASMPPRVVSYVDKNSAVEYSLVCFLMNLAKMDASIGGDGRFQHHFGRELSRLPCCLNDDSYMELFLRLFDRNHPVSTVIHSISLPIPPMILSPSVSLRASPPLSSSLFQEPLLELQRREEFFNRVNSKLIVTNTRSPPFY